MGRWYRPAVLLSYCNPAICQSGLVNRTIYRLQLYSTDLEIHVATPLFFYCNFWSTFWYVCQLSVYQGLTISTLTLFQRLDTLTLPFVNCKIVAATFDVSTHYIKVSPYGLSRYFNALIYQHLCLSNCKMYQLYTVCTRISRSHYINCTQCTVTLF